MFVILGLKTNKEAQLKELRRQLKSSATNAAAVSEALSRLASVFTFYFFLLAYSLNSYLVPSKMQGQS